MLAKALLIGLFIMFVLFLGIYFLIDGIKEREGFTIIASLFLILIVVLPIAGELIENKIESNLKKEVQTVSAIVVKKQHIPSRTTYVLSGKVMIPIHHAEKYDVEFKYEDLTKTIDNRQLYDDVKINDNIELKLIIYKNYKGEIIKKNLALTEDM